MKEKDIPLKNYIVLGIILILSILCIIYFYMWYGTYEENRLNMPIMNKYLSVINYNELGNYLVENKDVIIYFSMVGSEDIRIFERKFKNIIDDYSLNNKILYLNLTAESKNESVFTQIMYSYELNELPSVVTFKNGIVDDVYNIKANGYDVDNLLLYLKLEGVIND